MEFVDFLAALLQPGIGHGFLAARAGQVGIDRSAQGESGRELAFATVGRRGLRLFQCRARRSQQLGRVLVRIGLVGAIDRAQADGIVDQRWGEYRLQLVAPLRIEPAARPAPPQVPGDVRLAAFNLENLFNGNGRGGGFPTARGARSTEELQRQVAACRTRGHAISIKVGAGQVRREGAGLGWYNC